MDYLRPAVSEFDGIEVVHLRNMADIVEPLRVAVQNTLHILPDSHALRTENISRRRGRIVRTLAPYRGRRSVLSSPDESLADIDARIGSLHEWNEPLGRPFQIHIRILVARRRHETLPHVHPRVGDTDRSEVFRHDGSRDELPVSHDTVVPHLVFTHGRIGRSHRLLEFHIETGHPVGQERPAPELRDYPVVKIDYILQALQRQGGLPVVKRIEQPLERVRRLSHGGDDDEEPPFFGTHYRGDVAYSGSIFYRRAAEFIHFHIVHIIFSM